ncbi:predicted protein [Postia placenta Mad-698-R]|nr:predicted protein [Postia placenta Mad-698-R]
MYLHRRLLEKSSFYYKDPGIKLGMHVGFEQHAIISWVLEVCFFRKKSKKTSFELTYSQHFNPFSFLTMVLILAVIEHDIKKWFMGVHVVANFWELEGKPFYEACLVNLHTWENPPDAMVNSIRYIANTRETNSSVPVLHTRTFPSSPHPTWLPAKAKFTHSTLRTSSMSTSQTALSLPSTVASSSRAQIGHPNRSQKITLATRRSDEHNIRSVPEAPLHLNLPRGTLALSPPAPAFPKLSPDPVKYEEISLQTLRQSLSLRRVQVKKESRSLSPRVLLGPPR